MTKAGRHKVLWWCLLAVGAGGLALYCAAYAIHNAFPHLWVWPAGTVCLSVAAVFRLREWYQREPVCGPGLWQFGLVDLIGTAVFLGSLLAVFRLVNAQCFLASGLPIAALAGIGYIAGLVWGSRSGLRLVHRRILFSVGVAFLLVGALAVGGILVLTAVVFFTSGEFVLFAVLSRTFDMEAGGFEGDPILTVLRWSLVMLPTGFSLFLLGRSWMPEVEGASAEHTDAASGP